jgi:uncharacterized protein (TIGR02246 family)
MKEIEEYLAPPYQKLKNELINRIAEFEKTFNAHQPEALADFYLHQGSWINTHGQRLSTREEVYDLSRKLFRDMIADVRVRYQVENVMMLKTDIAVVTMRQFAVDASGMIIKDGQQSIGTFVMVLHSEKWMIAASQNMLLKR